MPDDYRHIEYNTIHKILVGETAKPTAGANAFQSFATN